MIGHHITNICERASALTFDLLVRKAQYSHPSRLEHILLTMMEEFCTSIQDGTHPTHNDGRFSHFHLGWNTSCSQWWKTLIQAGTHPTHNDERLPSRLEHILLTVMRYFSTYIHLGGNTSCSQWWKHFALTFIQAGTHPTHNDERALHLHPSRWEHILLIVMEGLALISNIVETNPTSYLVTDQVPPFS